MHPSFEEAAKHPDLVDEVVNYWCPSLDPECESFSKVFHDLFPATKQLNDNIKSFLEIFQNLENVCCFS